MRHWVREVRKVKGYSQADVAKISGISTSFYADIERGERTPSAHKAKMIGQTLGVDWTLFFE